MVFKKSLFGYRLLSSWESTFASYIFLLNLYILPRFFGNESFEIKAGKLFLILITLSILVLIFNSIKQKNKKPIKLWIILNVPLWISLPKVIGILILTIK